MKLIAESVDVKKMEKKSVLLRYSTNIFFLLFNGLIDLNINSVVR